MDKSKSISTLMSTSCSLDKDEGGNPVDERKYRGMIVFILYITAYHLDMMFVVCLCT